jgi:hypothetical protein
MDFRISSFRLRSSFSSLSSSMNAFFLFLLNWADRLFAARFVCFLLLSIIMTTPEPVDPGLISALGSILPPGIGAMVACAGTCAWLPIPALLRVLDSTPRDGGGGGFMVVAAGVGVDGAETTVVGAAAVGCGRVVEAAGITCCNCCNRSWLPPVGKRN